MNKGNGREVEESPFFSRLLAVMAEAGDHLGHLRQSPGSEPSLPLEPHDGHLGHPQQPTQLQQAHPAQGPSCSGGMAEGAGGSAGGEGLSAWGRMRSMVVFGLGSAHDSRVSRYQLALVLLLRDRVLTGLASAVQLYDPAFDVVDRLALAQLGLQALEVNEGGARRAVGPTFFYLPHCEGALCDALLRANMGPAAAGGSGGGEDSAAAGAGGVIGCSSLPLLTILGNSFKTYHDRRVALGAGAMVRAGDLKLPPCPPCDPNTDAGAVMELATPDLRFPAPSAFNDMALHIFPPSDGLARLLAAEREGGGCGGSGGGDGGGSAGREESMAEAHAG
ncbi:hypothetical protein GPECTOR_6g796 [Gonium pectorale]|uniref:SRR1-like domain-containing protein n=1 Tax=Gonium pectorale TaxID=33097 RepID=A0A150GW04_GONPE|nr:hypothetical protein GPECTOR_6g796 [Gonium pectorale]|eukprot:KXZ53878.1 hypothetical protein GPECTOR_6g796 [Gonium pectorale]